MPKKRKTDKTHRKLGAKTEKPGVLLYGYYTPETAAALLPPIGKQMQRIPRALQSEGPHQRGQVHPCTVVEVNPQKLWFRVRYDDLGFCECIKVPDVQLQRAGGWG
jgi:hypothetical protein